MAEENKMPGCVEEGVGAVLQPQLGSWTSGRTPRSMKEAGVKEVRVKPVARD